MSWNGSEVMENFAKIAKEQGLISSNFPRNDLGNPTEPTPVEGHTRHEPTEDYNDRYNEEGRKLIDKAHSKDAEVAKAMGKGALVENQNQQQDVMIDVATKRPNGALIGVHAHLIKNLVKMANELDEAGNTKAARLIDSTLEALPFDNGYFRKTARRPKGFSLFNPRPSLIGRALGFLVPWVRGIGLGIAGLSALKMFGSKLTSTQESLAKDVNDLYEILMENAQNSPSAARAAEFLASYNETFSAADFSTKEGVEKFASTAKKFCSELPRLGALIAAIKQDIKQTGFFGNIWEQTKGFFGFEEHKLIEEKFIDVQGSCSEALKMASQSNQLISYLEDKAAEKYSGLGSVSGLQHLLFSRGFEGKKWKGNITGKTDQQTLTAAQELEQMLNQKLASVLQKENKPINYFNGSIVRGNQIVADPNVLRKIVNITEQLA